MKRFLALAALWSGWVLSVCSEVAAQGTSPVGTWEVTILGADRGTAMMTFSTNTTVAGYGITEKQFGLFTLTGNWGYDANSNVVVAFVQSLDGVDAAGSFTAKFVGAGQWRGKGRMTGVGRIFRYKAELATDYPDLSGPWLAEYKQRGRSFFETYEVSPMTNFPGVFDIHGEGIGNTGTYEVSGAIIATSRNRLNASIDRLFGATEVRSSLFGKFKEGDNQLNLKGSDDTGKRLKVEARRQ